MKLKDILALFGLSAMVNGAFWAAVQPVILSLGAVFAALDLDLEPMIDLKPIEWSKLLFAKNEKDEDEDEEEENEERGRY